jgi:hypothetical protein
MIKIFTPYLCPVLDVNHPFLQCIHDVYATCPLVTQLLSQLADQCDTIIVRFI